MADIKSFPNNQDVYIGAQSVMKWHHGRTSGVFGAGGNAAVAAVQGEMAVTVSDGTGWMANETGDGIAWWIDTEQETGSKLKLPMEDADGIFDRIDRVVVSWETTNYAALPTVSVLKGTASGSPIPPELKNNGTLRQISFARIRIPAGSLSITNAMITDERLDAAVCGLVSDSVGIDTTVLHNQADALLRGIERELAQLESGAGVEMKALRFFGETVSADEFVPDDTYALYPYRARVPLSGVIGSMVPDVAFSAVDAVSGIYAPVSACYNGGIYVYASEIPDSALTIPTILCWRGA